MLVVLALHVLKLLRILRNLVLRGRNLIRELHKLTIIFQLHVALVLCQSRIVETVIHLDYFDFVCLEKMLDTVYLVRVILVTLDHLQRLHVLFHVVR